MESLVNIRIPWCLLVEPWGNNLPSWPTERDHCKIKTFLLFKMWLQLFFFFFLISFEDLKKWVEIMSGWDALSTAQNTKPLRCWVEVPSSQLSRRLSLRKPHDCQPGQGRDPSWASGRPPPLPQWLICNITSECDCKYFNMKRIDFCLWHGILMIRNNILIFFFN